MGGSEKNREVYLIQGLHVKGRMGFNDEQNRTYLAKATFPQNLMEPKVVHGEVLE